jgi:aromatic-L-amino-acid decarboxylase
VDADEFAKWSRRAAEWGVDYRSGLRERPVRAPLRPGEVLKRLPPAAPEDGEPMEAIFADFEDFIVPGMTHWQHPRFMAYFPANAAPASVVAEYLVSAMAAQCMLWQTSPAATELETRMVDWLRQSLGLPAGFSGVIQDSASTATLAAVLVMRERALGWSGNAEGLAGQAPVRIYCSDQVHTSVERAAWIAGIGAANLVRIAGQGSRRAMDVDALRAAIAADRAAGLLPAGVVASVGGTSTGGTDDIQALCAVAAQEGLYLHVDAAWAGSAMICTEFRTLWSGIEGADSIVFNPHKWLGAQFDCSVQFVRDPDSLVRTLAIRPEYLKTQGIDGVVNYSEWSVPLGRRFRALKLWFLLRAHGLEALREMIRNHVRWAAEAAERLAAEPGFAIVTAPVLSLFTFRVTAATDAEADSATLALLSVVNDDGRTYLTQTLVDGRPVIRLQVGQFDTTADDVEVALSAIIELARASR